MGDTFNVHQAKTQLSRLLARAEAGEEIVIARGGHPIAKLIRYVPRREPRVLGQWQGEVWIAPDFDSTSDEVIRLFEEGDV